jgi:hypothetical protein
MERTWTTTDDDFAALSVLVAVTVTSAGDAGGVSVVERPEAALSVPPVVVQVALPRLAVAVRSRVGVADPGSRRKSVAEGLGLTEIATCAGS